MSEFDPVFINKEDLREAKVLLPKRYLWIFEVVPPRNHYAYAVHVSMEVATRAMEGEALSMEVLDSARETYEMALKVHGLSPKLRMLRDEREPDWDEWGLEIEKKEPS